MSRIWIGFVIMGALVISVGELQFKWLRFKGIDAAPRISITLFSNRLKSKMVKTIKFWQ